MAYIAGGRGWGRGCRTVVRSRGVSGRGGTTYRRGEREKHESREHLDGLRRDSNGCCSVLPPRTRGPGPGVVILGVHVRRVKQGTILEHQRSNRPHGASSDGAKGQTESGVSRHELRTSISNVRAREQHMTTAVYQYRSTSTRVRTRTVLPRSQSGRCHVSKTKTRPSLASPQHAYCYLLRLTPRRLVPFRTKEM